MPQGTQQGTSLTDVTSAIARDRTLWRLGVQYAFFAFPVETNGAPQPAQVLGRVTLSNVQRGAFQCAYLGYWVDVEHCGQGLAGELVARVVRFAFDDLGLHRVQAAVMPENSASQRVLRRLGFRLEGRATRYLEIAGAWRDHDIFALLADEARPA
jgi:ribosomal-protein-alanine N-acetyltransferase